MEDIRNVSSSGRKWFRAVCRGLQAYCIINARFHIKICGTGLSWKKRGIKIYHLNFEKALKYITAGTMEFCRFPKLIGLALSFKQSVLSQVIWWHILLKHSRGIGGNSSCNNVFDEINVHCHFIQLFVCLDIDSIIFGKLSMFHFEGNIHSSVVNRMNSIQTCYWYWAICIQ